MKIRKFFAALISLLLLCTSVSAEVIYENGILAGEAGAQISPPQSITNSFSVDDRSLLTSVTLGLLSPTGSEPLSLTYSIGTTRFGSELFTGTALLSNEFQYVSGDFSVFLSSFNTNVTLDPGTYWLTLSNGTSTGDQDLAWLINGGPSQALFRNSEDGDEGSLDSEYFLLEGTVIDDPDPSPVPEPTGALITLTGLSLMVVMHRRKYRRQK